MLDSAQETRVRYFWENILEEFGMEPETARPLIQATWTKGYRGCTDDAYDYLREKTAEGLITDDVRTEMGKIIKKYSTWR